MVHSLLGGPIDVYLKKGKSVLNVSTSPSSTGIISAMLAQFTNLNEDESRSFELSFHSHLEGFSCLGSFIFKLHSSLLKPEDLGKPYPSAVIWHSSGNLLLVLLHGRLLLFGLKWLDKKHFNEEITFKEAVVRSIQLNLEDSLITEILSVGITLQTSLKKLIEKHSDSDSEYVTCVTPLRDGHSLLAGTSKGLYRVIHSWKECASFSLSLFDSTVTLKASSSDSIEGVTLPKYAYKGFQGHVLSRVWEYSPRGVSLNTTTNVEEPKSSDIQTGGTGQDTALMNEGVSQVEYTYSHISVLQTYCLPVRGSSELTPTNCAVAIQSDGSLTFSYIQSNGEMSPGGSLPILVSGHIHPVILTGYPLPRTLKAAKGVLFPCVYEKLSTSTEPVPTSVLPSFGCRSYVTEYDALVKAQSDIDAGVSTPQKKIAINGHCEEEISTVLAISLTEHSSTPVTHASPTPGVGAVSVPAMGNTVVSCIMTALVNTKHMPLAVRDLPVPAKTKDASASSSSGVLVDDRMESQSLVQWVVTVHSSGQGVCHVEFDCIQSVFVASQPCSRASESLKGTYTLNGCGNRLTAVSLNGLITVRLSASLHIITHCFDCHVYESSLLVCALGRLVLCHSNERPNQEDGLGAVINTSIQTIPVLSPLESTQKVKYPHQQDGLFYNSNSGHLYLLNNLSPDALAATEGCPQQYLTVNEDELTGSEESLRYDRIKVPKGLVEDVLMAQMINKEGNGRADTFVSSTGLIVACGSQVRTSYLNNGLGTASDKDATAQIRDYIALIPGGNLSTQTTSKYVANCSVLYLLNRRTNKWRTTLLSIPSTNNQKDLTMGSNAGAQVGKFSKARLIVQIPHINEVLDGHVNAELAAVAAAAAKSKAQEDQIGLRLGQFGSTGKPSEGVAPEGEGSRLRSNSFTSITSITSSAVSHSHKYFLNKSRQLTNRTNSSIYNQITSSVAIALHGSHTVLLVTQRKSRYFLEIVSREASRESLSSGKPQPNVHQLIALPPGFLPLGMTTQDIVKHSGADSAGITAATGGAGGVSGWVAPSASLDPELFRKQSQASNPATDHIADLDTAGSTHSSLPHEKGQVIGDKSCAVVLYGADGTFVGYSVTTLFNSAVSVSVSPKSPKSSGKVADFKVMELFTINIKQFLLSDERKVVLEPNAVRKFAILPLNAPLFESQQERHQLFTALSLPYVCLVLLSTSGTVYVADAYAKSVTVLQTPAMVFDISSMSSSSLIGTSSATDMVEGTGESLKCDVVYNDSVVLHCVDKLNSCLSSRHMWMSVSHTYPEDIVKSETTSDYALQVMSHNETDELFFANLHLTESHSSSAGNGMTGQDGASARLLSILVPLGESVKPFGLLPVECGEIFSMYLSDKVKSEESIAEKLAGKVVGLKESLLMDLIRALNSLRSKMYCASGSSDSCMCKAQDRHCVTLFRQSSDHETVLNTILLITLHQAVRSQKQTSSRFSYLLSCLEAYLRSLIVVVPKKSPKTKSSGLCPSAYQVMTSTLHSIDPLMLVEVVSRLTRRLEPAMSKQLFPLCVSLTKTTAADGQWRTSGTALDIIELFELCLREHLLHYCNRMLSVTCEHFGGSESHLTTVISLILSLEHLHLSLSGDNLQLVSECLEFCHRLEELLNVHSSEILTGSGASGAGGGQIENEQRSRSASQSGANNRRRRALSDSYVETVVQNALNQIRRKRNKLMKSEASVVSQTSSSSSAPTTPQGYYLGYGVMWLINTTASLFSDAPSSSSTPTSPSAVSSSASRRPIAKSGDSRTSLGLDTYKYEAIEVLSKKLTAHLVNNILCGNSVASESNVTVNASITMCLLMTNIRDLLSSSKHYASAALLLAVMLRQRTSVSWLHDHFDRHYVCNQSNESAALGAEAKVRRILFIFRLNKILAHGTKTAIYMALFNAEPPSLNGATGGKGVKSSNHTQGIVYNAQYLRRLIESEKIHTQTHISGGAGGGVSSSFYVSTPRVSHDHTGNPAGATASVAAALTGSASAIVHNRWTSENCYFELPDDLLNRKGALCAMDMLKALIVGLLLSGEDHCVYLLLKLVVPYMMMSESGAAETNDVELILRELFVAKRMTAIEASESVSNPVEDGAAGRVQYFEVRDRASVNRIFRLMIEGETEMM